ncbi:MAG: 30S ribosomal protein S16 [Actinobacteria bacterium]|nr:30S ribosomal protein S16 [Actinomycetota bacterium]NBO51655.1 30S ribosomal protein S16 [Actinomycetota bacterium]NCU78217.1 30S ribosomal protein S16 [Actinomycetota bacterium]NCU96412.1 30S ribosomal protein S16 [Actinomycetota bacterium]NDD78323.1 30S ribosomal protein S16 [Actinomycetota bacterium]
MSVKIKLMRLGKIRTPHFRIVIADSRSARNSKAIEEIGRYSPASEPSLIEVNSERVQYWLGVGAQPTEAVTALLKITGDYQKAKGISGSEGTLKPQPVRIDKKVAYEAAVKEAMNEPADGATTLKKKAADKLAAKSAPAVDETPVAQATPAVSETSEAQAAPTADETPAAEVAADVSASEAATEETPQA